MATTVLQAAAPFRIDADEQFFEGYRWCLNPMLSVRQLLQHLGEEIAAYRTGDGPEWQAEERRINLYLFACAIACTLDDYLAARPWDLSSVARRLPAARIPVRLAEAALNLPHAVRSRSAVTRAYAWRRQWTACVDAACELLLDASAERFLGQATRLLAAAAVLGETARQHRMRIPEAFRCQDLTHHDVCAMLEMCLPALPQTDQPVLVVGPRTAGAYFAPLAAAKLRALGYTQVAWQTVRPKNGFSSAESRDMAAALRHHAKVLIIDDHPNSGNTLRLLLAALRGLGAQPDETIVALPGHPSIPDFALPEETRRGTQIYLLPPEARYKARLLSTWPESAETAALNVGFVSQYSDGFQVRLKRVFDSESGRIIAKSVGWGWLGYHAWLAGEALEGFVPQVRSLRDGFMFSGYVNLPNEANPGPAECAAYIGERLKKLGLGEDPAFAPGYRWCGWDDLTATLSRIYGPRQAALKKHAIRRRLRAYVAPRPTLVDGRMKPADWVRSDARLLKTDFEHHNFGGGEPDIVDPAWDLASAIFECQYGPEAEKTLVDGYVSETGDATVSERLPLYKILYAMNGLRAAKYWLARHPESERREEWNRQFIATRSFAAFHLARHCGRNLGDPPAVWERRLCFLDLDGVFDWGLLGFPHTTRCGIQTLELLRQSRYSVVLNTARSLDHVREYCRAYRLPGGVAELGSVFWDALREWAVPLIDAGAVAEIDRVRDAIREVPGVFIDPENRYSIRAYRFDNGFMRPLLSSEVKAVLERSGANRLRFIQSLADTYIVQKTVGKGPAMAAVRAYLGSTREPTAAIGDSAQDVDMLSAADFAYAPSNASREVCELIARGKCRRTSRPLQAGLLEAATELCQGSGKKAGAEITKRTQSSSLLDELLQVPDRHPLAQTIRLLNWRGL